MKEVISFPGLGLEFEVDRVAFRLPEALGGWAVYWYGVIIAAAFLLGALYLLKRVKTFGLDPDRAMDVVLGGVVFGMIGARLYYVLFSWGTYADNPLSVFNIRLGGIAIYGGIIGAALGGALMCKLRKVKLLPMLDLVSAGMLLGQGIGRWGNFVNAEAFGDTTTVAWGMTSPSIQSYLRANKAALEAIGAKVVLGDPVHPTFLYESIWCLLGFAFLVWFTKKRRFDGQMSLIYIGWYGLGRFFIEGLRTDSLLLGTIRISQIVAALCVLASAALLVVISSRIKRSNDPAYMPLYVNTEEGKAVLAGTFYPEKKKKSKGEPEPQEDSAKPENAEEAESGEDSQTPDTGEEDMQTEASETEEETEEERDGGDDH